MPIFLAELLNNNSNNFIASTVTRENLYLHSDQSELTLFWGIIYSYHAIVIFSFRNFEKTLLL